MSRFFCLWIPHFEAWAVSHDGSLKLDEDLFAIVSRERIIAVSPAASECGIQVGFTRGKAQALAPGLQLISHHLPTTEMVWDQVLRRLYDFTPHIEPIRPGLLLADVHRPALIAPLLRGWRAHGGLADDRTTAELAAYTTTPGTLRNVRTGSSEAFLRRVPLTVFSEMSVGAEVIQRLGWFGWKNVADLRSVTKRQLSTQFDRGELLYRYAQATDTRPISSFRPTPQLYTRLTFEEPVREYYEIEPALPLLVERLEQRLDGRLAQTITVIVENNGTEQKQHRILRDATASPHTLCHLACELLRLLFRPQQAVPISMQRLEVILGGLTQPVPQQGTLFGKARPSIVDAVHAVERRFPAVLGHFAVTDPSAYLPEHFARLEPLSIEKLEESTNRSSKHSSERRQHHSPTQKPIKTRRNFRNHTDLPQQAAPIAPQSPVVHP